MSPAAARYLLTLPCIFAFLCSFYRFEPLTLIPMQKKLLDLSLLSPKELDWLDAYHETVSRLDKARWKMLAFYS